jgi:hypothetical protein
MEVNGLRKNWIVASSEASELATLTGEPWIEKPCFIGTFKKISIAVGGDIGKKEEPAAHCPEPALSLADRFGQ